MNELFGQIDFVKLTPMKLLTRLKDKMPAPVNILLAVVSAILLLLAFPGFEISFFAWFALVPLFYAINKEKNSLFGSFVLGWIFGVLFFFGTCWWLTYAPITYASFPAPLAYFLLFCATSIVALFPAVFCVLLSVLIKRNGTYAILSAPFLWTAIEFSRFWITGNNWNAVGYSQFSFVTFIKPASIGGVLLISFICVFVNAVYTMPLILKTKNSAYLAIIPQVILILFIIGSDWTRLSSETETEANVIAIQPNVPMSGLNEEKLLSLRKNHVELAETALSEIKGQTTKDERQTIVIFPESPMNFMYERDEEFQKFVGDFAKKNNVSVLFNAAEPDEENNLFFNSAVLVNTEGRKIAQYDKIYLVPFGESVPAPLQNIMPALVGSFSYGKEYDLLPFGDARGGVMICFESHFPNLSREYVRQGADVLIEMTNDGYLGNTPVLRQHLANAVFRAVETGRPVLRVTNIGITAYINERGEILDAADVYTEATRNWTISKSNGEQTFYVRYGDWFAWLCVIVSFGLFVFALWKKKNQYSETF